MLFSTWTPYPLVEKLIFNDSLFDLTKLKQRIQEKQAEALLGGGKERIEKQHAKGKLTARERIHFLMDVLWILIFLQ